MTKRDKPGTREIDRRLFILGSASLATLAGTGTLGCSDDDQTAKDAGRADASVDGVAVGDGPAGEGAPGCDQQPTPLPPISGPSRVVEVHDPLSVTATSFDDARIKAMLAAGLTELAGVTDIKQAWKTLVPDFSPTMRIGLKLNCLSSKLYNAKSLLLALIDSLVNDLGADASRIWVWDRRTDELTRSKLTEAELKVKVAGTIASTTDPSGPGYEQQAECVLTQQTHLSKILTQETDVTINLPLLKTHNVSAMTGSMKNIYGCIDNPGDFHDGFNKMMPAIYRLDPIRKHIRLHITDALKAVTKGDTTDYPDTIPARILLGTDPVAVDHQAMSLINTLRTENPNIQPLPAERLEWLDNAAKLNLGTTNVEEKKVTL